MCFMKDKQIVHTDGAVRDQWCHWTGHAMKNIAK